MNCHEFEAHWSSDDPARREEVRRHAEHCERCRRALRWELQLEHGVRHLRPAAPEGTWERILSRQRDRTRRRRVVHRIAWGTAAALAATWILLLVPRSGLRTEESDLLVSVAHLARLEEEESALIQQHAVVLASIPPHPEDIALAPLYEEVRFLDAAIQECRQALGHNSRHHHLRRRLLELTERRNQLLLVLAQGHAG